MASVVDERCSPMTVDKIVGEVFDSELQYLHFEKATPRKYVRARIPGTHDVVELLSQTTQLWLIWGLSLSFVPHVAGRSTETVQWHRTPKSANPDLRYSEDEGERNFRSQYEISTMRGSHVMREQALAARSALLPRALRLFESVQDLVSIESLFVHEEKHPRWGDLFNTPQVAMAYAFYLAKMGREATARSYFSQCLKRSHRRAETNDRLTVLFEEAILTPLILA